MRMNIGMKFNNGGEVSQSLNTKEKNNCMKLQNKNFYEQIENIRKQIQKISENEKLNSATKDELIKNLKNQIEEIEKAKKMLEQEQIKKNMKKDEENKEKNNSIIENEDGDVLELSEKASNLLKLDKSLKKSKKISSIKTSVSGEIRVLNSEIKMDKSREVDTSKKEKLVSKLEENLKKIDKFIAEEYKEHNSNIILKNNKVDNRDKEDEKKDENKKSSLKEEIGMNQSSKEEKK